MSPIPSIGPAELVILAGCAGLVTFIVAIVVAIVMRSRKRSGAPGPAGAGMHELGVTKKESQSPWKWIAILTLLVLIVLPLFVVVFGVLVVTPVRQSMSTSDGGSEPIAQIVVQGTSTATLPTALIASDAISTGTPQSPPTSAGNMSPDTLLSLDPFSTLDAFIIPPIIAGLVLLIGAGVISIALRRWCNTHSKDTDMNRDNGDKGAKTTKTKYALLTLLFWIALSIFLVLDLGLSVSLYLQFVAIYAAFWLLVGALLLYDRPMREKLLILVPFVILLFSVRFVDWNSRKPFLKDFYLIKEGMTPAQVEQIMGDYMKGGDRPLGSPRTEFNELGEIVTGTVTWRHTDEGWGNSDWGVVTFENGQVVQTEFLPD